MPVLSSVRAAAPLSAALVGLLLTGCIGQQEPPPPIVEPSEDEGVLEDEDPLVEQGASGQPDEPDGSPGEQPPVAPTIEVPTLDAQCVVEPSAPQVETVTYSVPSDWQVEGSCEFIDPDLEEQADGATESGADIVIADSDARYVDVVATGPGIADVTTWRGARAGYQASRRTGTATGEAANPQGLPLLLWAHDLDAGADDADGGVFTITTSSDDEQVQAVADAIAETVVLLPPADVQAENNAPESLAVVQVDQGTDPYAVTFDGDCFALRPGGPDEGRADQECGLEPTADPIVARILGEDVLVGFAPGVSIAVQSDELSPPYGLTLNVEGDSVFAFRVAELPTELTAIGPAGEELVTVPVP